MAASKKAAAADKESRKQLLLGELKASLPGTVDTEIQDYVINIMEETNEADAGELSEIISPLILDACPKTMSDAKVKTLCEKLINIRFPNYSADGPKVEKTLLNAPINLSDKLKDQQVVDVFSEKEKKSGNNIDRENLTQVQQRKDRRNAKKEAERAAADALRKKPVPAAQMVKKRPQRGTEALSRDLKLENFDVSIAGSPLLSGATLGIAYGRRYGLVGRNGVGKSSLLKALSLRELPSMPDHISILHVEQEVEGDDTPAITSVLAADTERESLLNEEKDILNKQQKEISTPKLDARLAEVYKRLAEIESDKAEPKASAILFGLGFNHEQQKWPTKNFSGGWRMRLALARALFCEPDLLLLDEPTNMLDMKTVLWLENYLCSWPSSLLVVSHDRDFLNAIATDIIHQFNLTLTPYKGNYDAYEKVRTERLKNQQRAAEAQSAHLKHVQTFIDRFRYNAKRASLVQSRIKMLAKMELVPDIIEDPTIVFSFPDPEPLSPPIIQFNDVSFGYTPERQLFKKLQFGLDLDSRVAVVGGNGQGKSTLLKLLTGELQATSGYVFKHHRLRLAKFSQHFVDQLDLNLSALEFYRTQFPGKDDQAYRSHLGSFGVSGLLALQSMRTLSGGQKSRVAFSLIGWKKPHFIVLDEPTNHLDIETVDVLANALNKFQGGCMLVTHDQRLITLVCNEMWICEDAKVTVFEGDFESYKKSLGDDLALTMLSQ